MECEVEFSSKHRQQHRIYETKYNIINQYFNNSILLQNTLLPFFNTSNPLKYINKQFQNFDYKKYNTHIQPDGILETYHSKSKKLLERKRYENGILNGLYELWYENGRLDQRVNFKNGRYDGLYEEWYENGVFNVLGEFKNDKKEGLWKEWYQNGQLSIMYENENGMQNGTETSWHLDGTLEYTTLYKNGRPVN
jgi:antitoxin component YwqK of YwqJK toxin-antitoxin module